MGSSIVCELSHGEMFIPIFWNVFAEDSEVCLEFSIDLFCFSICLGMVCGTDLLLDFAKFHKTSIVLEMKRGSLLEITILGNPNRLTIWFKWSLAASSAVNSLLQGIKITPFIRPWSTTPFTWSWPCSVLGNPEIKSCVIIWNGFVAMDLIGCTGSCIGCVLTLFC